MLRIAVLTISDAGARGERADRSGGALTEWVGEAGHTLVRRALVPDETDRIARTLIEWADGGEVDVILTTGGTGLSPRDVTPEATRAVLEREVPGLTEALRVPAMERVPRALLSRGVAGTRGTVLIVNLPGSTGGVRDGIALLAPLLDHAVALLHGQTEH